MSTTGIGPRLPSWKRLRATRRWCARRRGDSPIVQSGTDGHRSERGMDTAAKEKRLEVCCEGESVTSSSSKVVEIRIHMMETDSALQATVFKY